MKKSNKRILLGVGVIFVVAGVAWRLSFRQASQPNSNNESPEITPIEIDYPKNETLFPPEFPAPTWLWRDSNDAVASWTIRVTFANSTRSFQVRTKGKPPVIGKIDPRAVSPTNKKPALTADLSAMHSWKPDKKLWSAIKQGSVVRPVSVSISGHPANMPNEVISLAEVSIGTSSDPVGAPIFYRDVPLMPAENEKGVIKPLAPEATPLISWRLRDIDETKSRVLMTGIHTCANCHSFSTDGKTMGMDMDGPRNDKGLYALIDIEPEMSIHNSDLVAWSTFRGKLGSKLRVGFMSQLSPDGKHVVTTVNDPGIDQAEYQRRKNPVDLIRNYYVANFKDYRFLQVFFPTRGVLAWYSRETEHLTYLPGADDTEYVHNNAVWSPDGKYLVFARAKARDANPDGAKQAKFAGDPNEHQLKYDLYRIPFNNGAGGVPEPIAGASKNGRSNSFPKVSPDGRWIVYVQSKNGMLMRPDSQLYIVPAKGGIARRMTCNTSLMNSWHSFSPNSKWMVFSSKSRSPYTQMYLTHIDAAGNDSPAVLIENATAANRAVNIPEFVNIRKGEMLKIDAPAANYAKHLDQAIELMNSRHFTEAIDEWNQALALEPNKWHAHNSLGVALMETGNVDDAIGHYREALSLNPEYPEAYNNLGDALSRKGAVEDAIIQFKQAIKFNPDYAVAYVNLGMILMKAQNANEAIVSFEKVVELTPDSALAHRNLGHALAAQGQFKEANVALTEAVKLSGGRDALSLHLLGRVFAELGNMPDAKLTNQRALQLAVAQKNGPLVQAINNYLIELGQLQ